MDQSTSADPVEIPLSGGIATIVDSVDADLKLLRWNYSFYGRAYYVTRYVSGSGKVERLNRVVLERALGRALETGEVSDHINGNSLDNRRANLRVANRLQNAFNQKRNSLNTSGYKGVSWNKNHAAWCARIQVNYKRIQLGYFDTPEEAYAAYCEAAKKYHGEFARLE